MKKRKFILKNEKKKILQPNNKLFLDQLISQVNASDKKYGIKLKHPDVYMDPSTYREVLVTRSETNLAALICVVNGLEVDDYFVKDNKTKLPKMIKPVGIEDPLFTDSSKLKWDNKSLNYKTDSTFFRCRFSTLVLSRFLGNMNKITKLEADKKYDYSHSPDERRIVTTKNVTNDVILLTKLLLIEDASFQNIILKVQEHTSYCKKKLDHQKLRNLINGHILDIRRGLKSSRLQPQFYDDDFGIWMIIKAAYLLGTNNTRLKPVPSFKKLEGATVEHNLVKVIEDLGDKILKNKTTKSFPPMFKAFIDSRPSITTEFYKEAKENYNLKIGILALAYTKFVLNDDDCDEFIDKMLCKGK